ncbi:MAG: amino acid carrier protein [Acidobacteria bacterium]|nr:amino acid carrier protein [Acidobacteriota bacterium]MCB9396984.1 amino acid carrier protein [Acidobacteriota bacterium]
MDFIQDIIRAFNNFVTTFIVPEWLLIYTLLGTGLFLTIRLGLIQIRRLKHGFEVATGRYDDPNEPGDVSHFQALTTALSATVGVGNIAGVALAIHLGGPGALFWMWMTALLGMAVKFSEVTLALQYRTVNKDPNAPAWEGTVAGGPMYSIERGLGKKWKPLAMLFAGGLMCTSFLTGNAVQANTLTDAVTSQFPIPKVVVALVICALVALVIFGGIKRIGRVTSILAPVMGIIYFLGAVAILLMRFTDVPEAFLTIFREAFNPTSGAVGVGAGIFATALVGVKRGLFSNEAGQGSAPIAHSAAQTDEPVSEGVVALLEPFIDTIIICTLTGLVIVTTGAWIHKTNAQLSLSSGDAGYRRYTEQKVLEKLPAPDKLEIVDGVVQNDQGIWFGWHDVPVEKLFVDQAQNQPFTGTIFPDRRVAVGADGTEYSSLWGNVVENGAPLTISAFQSVLGPIGKWIVLLCVALFALSTAISWSYYGDRCAYYLFGKAGILPFKVVYICFHFLGAMVSLSAIWDLGDVALSIVTIPNLLALILLSGTVVKLTNSYFERKPWVGNRPGS